MKIRRTLAATVALAIPTVGAGMSLVAAPAGAAGGTCDGKRVTRTVTARSPRVVRGTEGNDVFRIEHAGHTVLALGGNDTVCGSTGRDVVSGGNGADTIHGAGGDDSVNGDAGNDRLSGDAGNDRVQGGAGDDSLDGGAGNDSLEGNEGNDRMMGRSGRDAHIGGTGRDTAVYSDHTARVVADDDGIADDGSAGEGDNVRTDTENIEGGSGNDTLSGNGADNTLNGGPGNDTLNGSTGNDTLNGGTGNDTVNGGAGDDSVNGGVGDDSLDGGDGDDSVNGESGDDSVRGGRGRDRIRGGSGSNRIDGGEGADDIACETGSATITPDASDSESVDCEDEDHDGIVFEGTVTAVDEIAATMTFTVSESSPDAVTWLNDNSNPSTVTVSTSGVVPVIRRAGDTLGVGSEVKVVATAPTPTTLQALSIRV